MLNFVIAIENPNNALDFGLGSIAYNSKQKVFHASWGLLRTLNTQVDVNQTVVVPPRRSLGSPVLA
jgi:hypothetical protein